MVCACVVCWGIFPSSCFLRLLLLDRCPLSSISLTTNSILMSGTLAIASSAYELLMLALLHNLHSVLLANSHSVIALHSLRSKWRNFFLTVDIWLTPTQRLHVPLNLQSRKRLFSPTATKHNVCKFAAPNFFFSLLYIITSIIFKIIFIPFRKDDSYSDLLCNLWTDVNYVKATLFCSFCSRQNLKKDVECWCLSRHDPWLFIFYSILAAFSTSSMFETSWNETLTNV